jgi:hypothetical protein
MKIILPKPDIKCPECEYQIDDFTVEGHTLDCVTIDANCDNCGAMIEAYVIFEKTPKICNCGICQKIKAEKNEPRN